ncbi:hypothetical protein H0H93_013915 [Arthromyces matolae]|nr:hypothetical protein H0H93_013915 [Arthromyces matolae]
MVRTTSFILRAIIAGPGGNNVGLLIGDEVLFAIGFFSLLYSTYNLVLDSIGISDVDTSNNPGTISTGKSLHLTSTIIFLVLSALVVYQALIVAKNELRYRTPTKSTKSMARGYQPYVLLLISVLLLLREAFAMATVNAPQTYNDERLWYPLIAMPEVLAAILFNIPGLVPAHRDAMTQQREQTLSEQGVDHRQRLEV